MYNFLFWLFLAGSILACMQDLKRREVDNWLNYFLGEFGLVFLVFSAIFLNDWMIVVFGLMSFGVMFVLGHGFYYGRIFAGGDAKFLIAIFALFVGLTWMQTLENIGIFVLFLMLAGAAYGLLYGFGLFVANFRRVSIAASEEMKHYYFYIPFIFGLILVFFNGWSLFFGIMLLIYSVLFVFAKSIENSLMIHSCDAQKLQEGDWLFKDVKVGQRTIKANWDGLTLSQIAMLRKANKKVFIKEGIPFMPAFVIALLMYYFFSSSFLNSIFSMFGF